ncbi:MAG: hypothetical protein K0S75_1752 [Clostridia bacterium]|nr:hypothetical protein [Clostridia bacterium]
MKISHDIESLNLTSGEIAELFNTYLNNSASTWVLSYLAENAQDTEIKSAVYKFIDASKSSVEQISAIFKSINHPVPKGFSAEDVNLKAKSLFGDKFILTFIRYMARFGLTNYSEARACCTRADVRTFFNEIVTSTLDLLEMTDILLLNKGLYVKEPIIPIPDKIDFIEKQSFINGFIGEQRPINASEINRLYFNVIRNSLGKAFLIGMCQTVENKELKEFYKRGIGIAEKHMNLITSIIQKEDLPIPESFDSEVTDSTETVFSDKLVTFFVVALISMGIGVNGVSLSRVMRRDISLVITRFMAEIALYSEDGFNIMIDKGWLERIPEAADRKELIRN